MLRTAAHHAKKALTIPRYYGKGLLKVLTEEPAFVWAQAIAFKTLVTLLPLLLLVIDHRIYLTHRQNLVLQLLVVPWIKIC